MKKVRKLAEGTEQNLKKSLDPETESRAMGVEDRTEEHYSKFSVLIQGTPLLNCESHLDDWPC